MGNGDEASGDGWKFHGRGLIQLTGRSNYEAFASEMGMDVDAAVEYLATPEGAAMSAAWFWDKHDLNKWSDDKDVLTVTKKINGGTLGLEDRKALFEEALTVFA
jgi:putative chitinase